MPKITKKLHADLHCPSCGDDLVSRNCVDPWAICLVCMRDHRFFILPPGPLSAFTATTAAITLPETGGLSIAAIASFWLSDPRARWVLSDQLAVLLRAIVESRSILDEPHFDFCPICGEALVEYERPLDLYMKGLRCQTDHRWALRSGRLHSAMETVRLELQAEYSDTVVRQLIASWLRPDPLREKHFHDSIRRVLISSPLAPQSQINRSD